MRRFVDKVKEEIRKKLEVKHPRFISTGSTMLNLAMTDDPFGGWVLGTFNNLVGDSDTGKTLLLLQLFAEANKDPRFAEYDLYHDEPEQKNLFDLSKFKLDTRLHTDVLSRTIQEWTANCWKLIGKKNKFIYGLDSFDSVGSDEERERFDEMVKQMDSGKDVETQGSYQTERAKGAKALIRELKAEVSKTDSLIVVVRQTIDNIGARFGGKTSAGGGAWKFNSTHEIWLRVVDRIKKKDRVVGTVVEAMIKKNHYNGKIRSAIFPMYGGYGVDDIGSMIDWLLVEKFWKKDGQKIDTGADFSNDAGFSWKRDDLIKHIEDNNLEDDLRMIVGESWIEIEKEITLVRKEKY
jgi:RecA/RadA recombinase